MSAPEIPGYRFDDADLPKSPVTPQELDFLKTTLLFTEADELALRQTWEILRDQVEPILDVWYGFVGSHPHLVAYFSTPEGEPIAGYLAGVRPRFGKWIEDTCTRPYDETWLAYQEEIGLRHTPAKKNLTDGARSLPHIPLRYLIAFIYPITATIRPFLAAQGHDQEQVDAMHQAWFKAVTLQVTLWTRPYGPDTW
ncbi:protoglobin domain-containing protein [Streptomyces sp. NPDC014861]|uniref:protoglobin domain-containing protein n=1 Tax=Streptomyces sp. NPDC014861 TaxID=3364923 RepID=UPI00370296F4